MIEINQSFLTKNPCYQANVDKLDSRYSAFQAQGPKGLMLHSVGCPQPSAQVFVNKWNRADYDDACVHAFIDADSGAVWQTLPWNFRAWHCGGSGNNTHVGVEICESRYIRYTGHLAEFEVLDRARAQADARRTYATAVELFAALCAEYKLNPLEWGVIRSHNEGGKYGIASGHVDPEHYWTGLGMDYTMNGFRQAVAARMKEGIMTLVMTKEELAELAREQAKQVIEEALGPEIKDIADVPYKSLRPEVRALLDSGAINGGTPADVNPNDIGLRLNILRSTIMSARYAAHLVEHKQPHN